MAQLNDPQVLGATLVPDLSPDRTPDHLEIFSAPGVDAVLHWWAESNRRWAETNRQRTPIVHPVVVHEEGTLVPFSSDRE
jgi:hypothetical protein